MKFTLWFWGINDVLQDSRGLTNALQETKSLGFDSIGYSIGSYNTDGTIQYTSTLDQALQICDAAHNLGLKVYSSLDDNYSTMSTHAPNVTLTGVQDNMAAGLTDLLTRFPFDGQVDALEASNAYQPYGVIAPNLTQWFNRMAQLCHSQGKEAAFYDYIETRSGGLPVTLHRDIYPGLTGLDFAYLHFEQDSLAEQNYQELLTYLPANIGFQLQVRCANSGSPGESVQSWINFLNGRTMPGNFAGLGLWADYFLTASEKTLIKNLISTYTPTPPPPTYQEWIVTKTEPQPTQEWKVTVTSPPGKVSGWM